jgi:iron-sulfur cluster assembly protein
MLTLTQAAAKQVRRAAQSGDMDELALRIAASRQPDGSIDYRMGFDEISAEDVMLSSRGVDVIISNADKELLNGMTLDYIELEPGDFQFIFMNPNDPNYVPPGD